MRKPQSRGRKLTREDAALIRQLIADRKKLRAQADALSNDRIAEKFECARGTIDRIQFGKLWT
ncbi:MAG TPA: hypothetical protein VFT88_05185 [Acidobacteriaceae bacterium]|nr:hypothetical protein [Acidobacteriaceae bacterium]